jgi:tryptophan synthase alpha chain
VDVLELGVPFSDPLADGLVNQLAAQRGLESGTTPPKVLETVAAIRKDSQIPIVLYIYFNLIHKVGLENSSKPRPRRAWTACWCSICRRRNRTITNR